MKFYADIFGITLTVTILKTVFHVMSSSAGDYFGMWFSISWELFNFYFHEIFYRVLKTLWPLFMDWIQLSEGYRALTKRQLTFTTKSPDGSGLTITLMVLVLCWQSLHKRKFFLLNPPSARGHFYIFLGPCYFWVCFSVLRNSVFSDDIYLHRTLGNSL